MEETQNTGARARKKFFEIMVTHLLFSRLNMPSTCRLLPTARPLSPKDQEMSPHEYPNAPCGALSASLAALAFSAMAQDAGSYPNSPIKLVVGFVPGGSSDTVARILAPRMADLLKQSIVIDNRPGAGGNIASEFLIKAPADGYTLMRGMIGSLAVNQHLNKFSYNPVADTAPLSLAVTFTNVLVLNASSDIRSLDDYERSSPFCGRAA